MVRNTHSSNECWHTYHQPIQVTWNPFVSPGHYSGNATGHHCFLQAPGYSEMCVCVCVCGLHLFALYEVVSFFFFLIAFHTPDDDQRGTCGLRIFIFLFRLCYQKTWLLACEAITGTDHYDIHPPLPHMK